MSIPRCEDLSEELVAYLDGEQPEDQRARIDAHVATCLACRREMERLTKLRGWLEELPRIEPSGDFDTRMWERLRADTPLLARRRIWRSAHWGVPVLAAAAAIALMFYSSTDRSVQHTTAPTSAGRDLVARAPAAPAAEQLAADKRGRTSDRVETTLLSPDDLPPELVEHPELFLRYPVVRRMNKLEHFEEVRRHGEDEPLGANTPSDHLNG